MEPIKTIVFGDNSDNVYDISEFEDICATEADMLVQRCKLGEYWKFSFGLFDVIVKVFHKSGLHKTLEHAYRHNSMIDYDVIVNKAIFNKLTPLELKSLIAEITISSDTFKKGVEEGKRIQIEKNKVGFRTLGMI